MTLRPRRGGGLHNKVVSFIIIRPLLVTRHARVSITQHQSRVHRELTMEPFEYP